ncbi:hypothetical protein ACIPLR_17890 [Herbaspirillum huttiense]|uniref:hypothetical protein n=1 Tax=Herbaspirillum huttiense TaxID=863372 RepID=UPI00380ED94F
MAQATIVDALSQLMHDCQEKKQVARLAEALGLRRQTIYLWRDTDEQNERRARQRLWEISNINVEQFPELQTFAVSAAALLDGAKP